MQPRVEATAINLENTAHAGEFEFASVSLNKRVLHLDCFAKYAAAFFRMTFDDAGFACQTKRGLKRQ